MSTSNFISEQSIEAAIESLSENESTFNDILQSLMSTQPHIGAYIIGEDLKFLSEEEKNIFFFIVIVIFKSISENNSSPQEVSEEEIGEAEEANWEKIQSIKTKDFRKKLDPFFEKSSQEDLLAFLEDSLTPEEEDSMATEAREYIFVAAKTIIDVLS